MGMNPRDVGVFVFLFTQRWFEKKIAFSAPEIMKSLNPISSILPNEIRTNYSEKSVGTSLIKLVILGFVTECKNQKKNKTGGRSAKILYETVKLPIIRENLVKILDDYKRGILHTISPFEAMEEGITLKEGNLEEE